MNEYLREPTLPLFLWLRLIVGERLLKLHRHHLGHADARRRAARSRSTGGRLPAGISAALAAQLLGKHTSPTQAAVRAERMLRLQEALNTLDADRPRDPVAPALRGTEPGRDGPVAGHRGVGRRQALHPSSQETEGDRSPACPGGLGSGSETRLRTAPTDYVLLNRARRRVRRAVSRRENGRRLQRVHRPIPRAGRRDPRALPRHGGDRAGQGRPPGDRRQAGRGTARRSTARRFPHPPRGRHGVAWASSTRPSRCRWAGTWRSRCCPADMLRDAQPSGGSSARRGPRPGCTTPTSSRSSASASTTACRYYVMQFIQGLGLDAGDRRDRARHRGPPRPQSQRATCPLAPTARTSPSVVARSLVTGPIAVPAGHEPEPTSPTRGDDRRHRRRFPPRCQVPAPVTSPAGRPSVRRVRPAACGRTCPVERTRARPAGRLTYWQSVARVGIQVASARWIMPTAMASCTGTSSRRTCCSTRTGRVWVTDFGLAKTDDQEDLTPTGDILGTLRYMPPEAFEGRSDARGDVYRLGLTLYELLALRPAFDERERNQLIQQVTTDEAAPAPEVPTGRPPGPGDDRPQGDRQGPGPAVPDRRGAGGGPPAIPRR